MSALCVDIDDIDVSIPLLGVADVLHTIPFSSGPRIFFNIINRLLVAIRDHRRGL